MQVATSAPTRIADADIPVGRCRCPVCDGTKEVGASEYQKKYKHVMSKYNLANDTVQCNNCGGQYMFGSPKGHVKPNAAGDGCWHDYKSSNAGRCLTNYVCQYCGDAYQIDSGD